MLRRLPSATVHIAALLPQRTTGYARRIARLNAFLVATVQTYGQPSRLHFLDCSTPFLVSGGGERRRRALMPDGIHPSLEGYTGMLLQCWGPALWGGRPGEVRGAARVRRVRNGSLSYVHRRQQQMVSPVTLGS